MGLLQPHLVDGINNKPGQDAAPLRRETTDNGIRAWLLLHKTKVHVTHILIGRISRFGASEAGNGKAGALIQ